MSLLHPKKKQRAPLPFVPGGRVSSFDAEAVSRAGREF